MFVRLLSHFPVRSLTGITQVYFLTLSTCCNPFLALYEFMAGRTISNPNHNISLCLCLSLTAHSHYLFTTTQQVFTVTKKPKLKQNCSQTQVQLHHSYIITHSLCFSVSICLGWVRLPFIWCVTSLKVFKSHPMQLVSNGTQMGNIWCPHLVWGEFVCLSV